MLNTHIKIFLEAKDTEIIFFVKVKLTFNFRVKFKLKINF